MAPGASGILDTSTVVLLERLDPGRLPIEAHISAVTLAELSVGPLVASDEAERSRRLVRLLAVEQAFHPVLPFDTAAARAFGEVAASLRRAGRKHSARAFDALIAAVALSRRLPLYTVNPRDFHDVAGLEVAEVPHPDHGG